MTDSPPHGASTPPLPPVRAWYTLALLSLVMLFAGVDRQVLVLLGEPVRKSLGLSDLQLGLLQGPPVALLIVAATYPLAWLVDRVDRRLVLLGSVLFWSLAVVGCGLAGSYPALFAAAALVGIGEAGIGPLSIAAIPDLFARKSWQTANSVFSATNATGGALTFAMCGALAALAAAWRPSLPHALAMLEPWRLTFFLAALPAPLMMVLILTLPVLKGSGAPPAGDDAAGSVPSTSFGRFMLEHRRAFIQLFMAFGCSNLGYNALLNWISILAVRDFGQTATQVGTCLSLAGLASLPIGFVGSIFIARYLGPRIGPAFPILVSGTMMTFTALLVGTIAFVASPIEIYAIVFFGYALNGVSAMLLPTAIQTIVPAGARARLSGLQIMTAGLIAPAGAPLVGVLSDHLGHGHGALQTAIAMISAPALLVGGMMLWLNRAGFTRAAEDARSQQA